MPDYTEGTKSLSWSLWFSAREFYDDISYGFFVILKTKKTISQNMEYSKKTQNRSF